ncbi:unnamed protein product [Symbiodinium necroappetens]|uniref:Uncharacterized protein n=1 Tax=Symbiodinium necroappetens TaxID=1628268 RepID=A0A812X4F3_9DINO|nr:unnamed protein product [Symbiodinium necroappetens]
MCSTLAVENLLAGAGQAQEVRGEEIASMTKAPIAPVSENSRQMGGAVWTCAGIRPEASRIRIRVVHVIQEVCWKQANLGDTRRLLVRPLLSQQQPGCHLSLHDQLQNAASCSIQLALQRLWSLNGFTMRFPSVDFPRH